MLGHVWEGGDGVRWWFSKRWSLEQQDFPGSLLEMHILLHFCIRNAGVGAQVILMHIQGLRTAGVREGFQRGFIKMAHEG